tara:strand:- start:450 stop:1133 length:684 start_codon:yes stop_codon:yes gene_type:complete
LSRILGFFSEKATDTGTDLTTKGDIHGYSDTNTRVPIGSNDQILTADSSEALGLKWATSSGLSSPLTSNLVYNDSVEAAFGTGGSDSNIKHDGSNLYCIVSTGQLLLSTNTTLSADKTFCYNKANATISSDTITGNTNVMQVDTEGSASSDDLDHADFTAAGLTGAMFTLKAKNGARTVVVKDTESGSPQFLMAGDFSLDNDQDTITFSAINGLTHNYENCRSDNGS